MTPPLESTCSSVVDEPVTSESMASPHRQRQEYAGQADLRPLTSDYERTHGNDGVGSGHTNSRNSGGNASDLCDGMDAMDAFEVFNKRAEARVQELFAATERQVRRRRHERGYGHEQPPLMPVVYVASFALHRVPLVLWFSLRGQLFASAFTAEVVDESEGQIDLPSYILMSDQYRHARPPAFHLWQECFPYLEVVGTRALDEAPDEHIQIRQPVPLVSSLPEKTEQSTADEMHGHILAVHGQRYTLRVDTGNPPQEELILADGETEEVLEEDHPKLGGPEDDDATVSNSIQQLRRQACGVTRCLSPARSRREETVDEMTMQCFSSIVSPLVVSLFESMLRKHQRNLRIDREQREDAVRRVIEAQLAADEEQRRKDAQEKAEREAYEAAVAKALEEEQVREEARREELLRQQREENDEEEIKIRTLAYSHTREWYQPQKKCFSHRGRKMTYLKPVLKSGASDPAAAKLTVDASLVAVGDDSAGMPCPSPVEIAFPETRKRGPVPPSIMVTVTTRHSASPRLRSHRAKSPSQSPITTARTVETKQTAGQEDSSVLSDRLRLPHLPTARAPHHTGHLASPPTKAARDDSRASSRSSSTPLSAAVVAPGRVYAVSPYRIPPTLLRSEAQGGSAGSKYRKRQPHHESKSKADLDQHVG